MTLSPLLHPQIISKLLIHEPLGGHKVAPPLRFVKYLRNLMSYERETWQASNEYLGNV